MLLTTDQEAIRDAVRAFAQAELWPNAPQWDRDHSFPKAAHEGLAALGEELRAIEAGDAGGDRRPRFKKSDDATALLLRVA